MGSSNTNFMNFNQMIGIVMVLDTSFCGEYYIDEPGSGNPVYTHQSKNGPMLLQAQRSEYLPKAYSDMKTIITIGVLKNHQSTPRSVLDSAMLLGYAQSRFPRTSFQGLNSKDIEEEPIQLNSSMNQKAI
jgi:hypothetical protein